ncbi:hypothetical protein KUCAC02_033078 [Chaenocephalus aceratus]|nr:hypothetical protein KUCAC02_033078 [Chaenocephalus aceratus]
MYRSRNLPNDEKAFHAACASLAWCISNARLDGETVALEELRVFRAWWDAQGSYDTRHIGDARSGNATRWDETGMSFCRTGLVNDNAWSALRPKSAGVRDASNVDVPEVWLGEHARTHDAISARLLALGVPHPMRVSVIESLSDREASDIRDGRSGFTTCKPESTRALLRALTVHKPSLNPSGLCDASGDSATGCGQTSKRSNTEDIPAAEHKRVYRTHNDTGVGMYHSHRANAPGPTPGIRAREVRFPSIAQRRSAYRDPAYDILFELMGCGYPDPYDPDTSLAPKSAVSISSTEEVRYWDPASDILFKLLGQASAQIRPTQTRHSHRAKALGPTPVIRAREARFSSLARRMPGRLKCCASCSKAATPTRPHSGQ